MKKRIVVIGLGDSGLLTAIRLPTAHEIAAVSSKPCFVSGQELGTRLARLEEWKDLNQHDYDRFRGLDHVRIVHGVATGVDLAQQRVAIEDIAGRQQTETFDVLLVATGTTNGFWRNAALESSGQLESGLASQAEHFANAQTTTIAIVGGGPTAVSAASNLKQVYPTKSVHVFFSRAKLLEGYPERTRDDVQRILADQGVALHPHHRAIIDDGVDIRAIGSNGEVRFQENKTGQQPPPFEADKILWAVGAVRPNNRCLPEELLDEDGFVAVTPQLHHPVHKNVFAIGYIAASDPNRSTARNAGFVVAARNIDLYLRGWPHTKFGSFRAPRYRWGSILGVQERGMRIYSPRGWVFVIRRWFTKAVLFPIIVHNFIYKGIRKTSTTTKDSAQQPREKSTLSAAMKSVFVMIIPVITAAIVAAAIS